jgi:hypothetical protein
MANYYTQASFIIPLTEEQTVFAVKVIECFLDEKIDLTKRHKTKASKAYDNAVFCLARKLAKSVDEYDPDNQCIGFSYQAKPKGLWISHDENINTDNAGVFTQCLLKHFDIDAYVAIEAAHTCDRARLDGFGGHALFITKKHIRWVSTFEWIERQARRSGLKRAE